MARMPVSFVIAGVYRTPSLWFDHNLEEAATFYTSVFPNSHIESFNRSTDAGAGDPGSVLSGSFVLDGTRFIGNNVYIQDCRGAS
jgi:predicted 3-demethylubiquinone-9 3-methyltransferase (glyoxalase superfamily)